MANRTYYGEYSLTHWIRLIVTGNIELPTFQRSFVWNKDKATELIDSLKDGKFVPPVTIGVYSSATECTNLIIDGQQRLTSILLACLKRFPKKNEFVRTTQDSLASGDDETEYAKETATPEILDWTLKNLTDIGNSIDVIRSAVMADNRYEIFDNQLDNSFFNNTYIGFSYLVPDGDFTAQQKFYASVFRKINILGVPLLPLEARQSLYFVEPSMKPFFAPDEMNDYKVLIPGKTNRLDFVRYLSTLTQYHSTQNSNAIARGYYNDMESYYADFINKMVAEKIGGTAGDYMNLYGNNRFEANYARLLTSLQNLGIPKEMPSIIDMDVYFFGLVYWCILKGRTFMAEDGEIVLEALQKRIARFKSDIHHKNYPNLISRLRTRMERSINIYRRYAR